MSKLISILCVSAVDANNFLKKNGFLSNVLFKFLDEILFNVDTFAQHASKPMAKIRFCENDNGKEEIFMCGQ